MDSQKKKKKKKEPLSPESSSTASARETKEVIPQNGREGRLEVDTRVSAGGGTVVQSVLAVASGGCSKGVGGRS